MKTFLIYLLIGIPLLNIARSIIVLIHQLGHAIPALIFTRKKVTIFIGSHGETDNSFKFSIGLLEFWFKKKWFWRIGICIYSSTEISLSKQIIVVLSGLISSLTITAIAAYFVFKYDMHGSLKVIIVFFALRATADFIENIIPHYSSQTLPNGEVILNDITKLQQLFRQEKYLEKNLSQLQLALKLFRNKEFANAIPLLEQLKETGQDNNICRLIYISYIHIKDHNKAYEFLKILESKEQLESNDYYCFSCMCSCLGLIKEKNNYLEKSLKLNPDNPFTLNAIGCELNKQKKFEEAIIYFNRAIIIRPELAFAYNNRGYAKIELEEFEEGLADINCSLKIDKGNIYAYRSLGFYHLKLSQLKEAENFLSKAKEFDENTEMIRVII